MKKKLLSALLCVVMAMSLAVGCGASDSEKTEENEATTEEKEGEDVVITAYTQSAYPPFAYLDEDDVFQGLDPEVLREIDARLDGYTIDIQTLPWDSQFVAVENSATTIMCNQVAITEEREEKYYFSDPYFIAAPSIIVKKGSEVINSLEDLEGKTVWAQVGDSYTAVLEKYNEEHNNAINLYYVENQMLADAMYDLQTGKFDAIINDPVMAYTVIQENNLDCEVTGDPVYEEMIGIVFNKSDQGLALKEKIDPIIQEMKDDGTLSKLSVEITGADYIPE